MKNIFKVTALVMCTMLTTSAFTAGDAAAGKTKSASCQGCHGLNGKSNNPKVPNLNGQKKDYLITAINAYKNDKRKDPMMGMAAKPLTDADIADLAAFYSSVK